ncbi:hypothetical protein J6590_071884 [Homalodisca vitripennis]|nr:hypothetical protein J6590_071884 [Homalodisca vitripennis]
MLQQLRAHSLILCPATRWANPWVTASVWAKCNESLAFLVGNNWRINKRRLHGVSALKEFVPVFRRLFRVPFDFRVAESAHHRDSSSITHVPAACSQPVPRLPNSQSYYSKVGDYKALILYAVIVSGY